MARALVVMMAWVISGLVASAGDPGKAHRDGAAPPRSNIYKLEELAWPRIDAFDRDRTLFILTVGMIEEHGPHLPVGADTLGVMHEAKGAARRVSRALPDWDIVIMPPIHYGQSGANRLGDQSIPAPTAFANRR